MNKSNKKTEIGNEEIFKFLADTASSNLISVEATLTLFKEALTKSIHSKIDPDAEIEINWDIQNNIFDVYIGKIVIEDDYFDDLIKESSLNDIVFISTTNVKEINPAAKLDDVVKTKIDLKLMPKELFIHVNQIFLQSLKESKKEAVYEKYIAKQGENIEVIVKNVERDSVKCEIEFGLIGVLLPRFRNASVPLKLGQRVNMTIESVKRDAKGTIVLLSQGSKDIIKRAIELEIPETTDGTIEIVNITRQVGIRTKVLVRSNNENVDPVGTIIGVRGARISNILKNLGQEKIDVIQWTEDKISLIANTLEPARVISINPMKDEEGNDSQVAFTIVVPDQLLTLAIGKNGTNVKLAADLLKFKFDLISLSVAKERGIELLWNANVTPQDVERLEKGIKITRVQPQRQKPQTRFDNKRGNQAPKPEPVIVPAFDETIEDFKKGFETFAQEEANEPFNGFTDDELKQMESAFDNFDDAQEESLGDDDSYDDELYEEYDEDEDDDSEY